MRYLFLLIVTLAFAVPAFADSLIVTSGGIAFPSFSHDNAGVFVVGDDFNLGGGDWASPLFEPIQRPGATIGIGGIFINFGVGTLFGHTYDECSFSMPSVCPSMSTSFGGILALPTDERYGVTNLIVPVTVDLGLSSTEFGNFTLLARGIATIPIFGDLADEAVGFVYTVQTIHIDLLPPVPEPSTWLLFASGLTGLLYWRHRHGSTPAIASITV